MIQSRLLLLLSIVLMLCCFTSCESESKVFVGEWQDSRESVNKWTITKSGSKFKGVRTGAEDYYKYDSEEWTYELGESGFPTLVPSTEEGSTIIFQPKQNRILRSPPGRAYVKVEKSK